MSDPRPVKHLLRAHHSPATDLVAETERLNALTALLRNCLGPDAAADVQVASQQGQRLVLAASSTAWVTRLRYQAPQLLKCLQRQQPALATVTKVELRVIPPVVTPHHSLQRATLSSAGAAVIRSAAAGIPHPELRAALQRLARRAG